MDSTQLYLAILLALATAAISVTLSRARIFASLREWIARKNAWLGDLISCYYCTSHWAALILVAIYRPVLIQKSPIVDYLVSVFSVVAVAVIFSTVMILLIPFRSQANQESELVRELRASLRLARAKIIEQDRMIKGLER